MHSIHQLLGGSYLLRALGLPVDNVIQGLEDLHDQIHGLQGLQDTFSMCAGMMGAGMLANLLQNGGIPGAMFMPPPNMGMCSCGHQYAPSVGLDFGAAPGGNLFEKIMARGQGAQFEQYLMQNPFARAQVEMMLGGRIIPDGFADGRIRVQPFGTGGIPGGANPAAMAALGLLDTLSRAAMSTGFPQAFGPGMFHNMMLGALNNVLNQFGLGGGGGGGLDLFNPSDFLGNGNGRHAPGVNGPHQGKFGISEDGGDASGVLNDPTLTVEDKVTLMIMLIMKKMDKDIEKMANYINQLQQQQNKGGGGKGGGGKGGKGGGGGGGNPSIDVETMKLKRLIDKRSQMFDMLRQIIDKYNQTAKGIIDSMGR
jgi:hypothetical protein